MQPIYIGEKEHILIVAPHPDDECIGAGGIISVYPSQCDLLVLTDGRLGQGDVAPEEEKQIRKNEFLKEMQLVQIKNYQMLDIEDGTLMQHTDCLKEMDLKKYSKVFVTGMQDNHSDHTAAFISVINIIRSQQLLNTQVFVYEVHAALPNPTHMLDITDKMNDKLKLIRCHQSQLSQVAYDRLAEVNAEYRALQNRMQSRYIEVYSQVNVIDEKNPMQFELEAKLQKQIKFYQVLVKWMEARNRNNYVGDYLCSQGYKSVSIYGYAELGKLLYQELSKSKIKIVYIIDKKVARLTDGEDAIICKPQKNHPVVDAVIVTAIYYYEEIKEELEELGYQNIISLQDIISVL